MDHARHRRCAACPDIGGRAGNGAGDANAAEQRRTDIADALCDQLHIGAMPASRHAVGDDGGQQAFDAAQQRESHRIGQNSHDLVQSQIGNMRGRQQIGDATEFRADCIKADAQFRQRNRHKTRGDDGDQQAGPMGPVFAAPENQPDRQTADQHRRRIDGADGRRHRLEFGDQRARLASGQLQPEQINQLAAENDHRNTGGKTDRHRMRNIFDDRAKPQKAQSQHHHARQQHRQHQSINAVPLDGDRDQHDEGAGRTADLVARPAQQRDQKTTDHGGKQPAIGRGARGLGNRHRQWQSHHRHRNARQQIEL